MENKRQIIDPKVEKHNEYAVEIIDLLKAKNCTIGDVEDIIFRVRMKLKERVFD